MKYLFLLFAVALSIALTLAYKSCNKPARVNDKPLRDTITLYDTLIKRAIDTVKQTIIKRHETVRLIQSDTLECLEENAALWRVIQTDSFIIDDQTRIIAMQQVQIKRLKVLDTINVGKFNACMEVNKQIQQARNKRRKIAKIAHIVSAAGLIYIFRK